MRRVTTLAIGVLLLCAIAMQAHATPITVTNTNDSGPGSLRQALVDANDGDTIDFAVTGIIGLTSGELLVDKSITISGPGADSLAVTGNVNSRVFHIGPDEIVMISGLTITNGHSTGNSPDVGGAGITSTVELSNSILNGQQREQIFNLHGIVTSHGYNLSSDDDFRFLTGPGDQINTDPLLGRLQDNGGRTLTHRPSTGSPAIDAGDPSFTPPPFFDQRGPGFDRVVNSRIDIGSFEVQAGKPPVRPPPTPRPRPTPVRRRLPQ